MTIKKEIIKKAVDKFLGWELPDFNPDGGISFKRIPNHTAVGTNLFSGIEAEEMFGHCLEESFDDLWEEIDVLVLNIFGNNEKEYRLWKEVTKSRFK